MYRRQEIDQQLPKQKTEKKAAVRQSNLGWLKETLKVLTKVQKEATLPECDFPLSEEGQTHMKAQTDL